MNIFIILFHQMLNGKRYVVIGEMEISNEDAIGDNFDEYIESSQYGNLRTFHERSKRSVVNEKENSCENPDVKSADVVVPNLLDISSFNDGITTTKVTVEEVDEDEDLEDKSFPDDYDVDDALYWIKTIKEKKQSNVMFEILVIAGDIETLKMIILQKYKQENNVKVSSKCRI